MFINANSFAVARKTCNFQPLQSRMQEISKKNSNLRSKSTGCQLKIHAREEKIARDHLNEADTNQTHWDEILGEVKPIMIKTAFLVLLIACDSESASSEKRKNFINHNFYSSFPFGISFPFKKVIHDANQPQKTPCLKNSQIHCCDVYKLRSDNQYCQAIASITTYQKTIKREKREKITISFIQTYDTFLPKSFNWYFLREFCATFCVRSFAFECLWPRRSFNCN